MRELESIFTEAIEIASPDERAAYLDRACGPDAGLRQRVERLLAAHGDPGNFLAARPLVAPATCDLLTESAGALIGPYKVLEQIGEGGFGVVFMAEQTRPVHRKVALKVLKPGMDTRQVVARFEAERQALALMDHPNIAHIFDGGETASGRPYFVMELVRGIAITEFCDKDQLTVRERLGLFINVCQAVQHAHQKGIIHRDLKPSNVLVTLHDGTPVVKVIDFGIAKAIGQRLTEKTLFTNFAQIIGTPLYMSPEQAALSGLDVDTRSDIYSLGVLLYELLTGTTPFDKEKLGSVGYDELRRIIREEEPPKPSTRISTLGQASTTIVTHRKSDPKRLSQLFRGELDWIVMKALEKDRNRRYETANALARDIERYLHNEPVEAGRPSAVYRLRKFLRRNKGPVLAASLVLLALVVGMIGTTMGMMRADQARGREADQRVRAEKDRDRTWQALDDMTSWVAGDSLTTQKELSTEQKKFLAEVLTYYKEFAAERGNDEQLRIRMADAARRVGFIEARLGQNLDAAVAFRLALDSYTQLAADFPAEAGYRQRQSSSHAQLAGVLTRLEKRREAEEQYRQALAIQEKLVAEFPTEPAHRNFLALTYADLGLVLSELGSWRKAEEQYRQALAIREKLVAEFPAKPLYRQHLAQTHNSLGVLLKDLGKRPEAEAHYRQALAIQEKLAAEFPDEPEYRQKLAASHNNLGLLLSDLRKRPEAEEHYRQALATWEKLVADFPGVPGYQVRLGGGYCNFGSFVCDEGQPEASLDWYEKAIRILSAVHKQDGRAVEARRNLRNSYARRAQAFNRLQKYAEAAEDWGRAIPLSSENEQPGFRAVRALARIKAGQVEEAVTEAAELTVVVPNVAGAPPWKPFQWYNFACIYALASSKSAEKKQEYADRALAMLRQAVQAGFRNAAYMKQDSDLESLRARADFKKLYEELANKTPAKTPKQP